MHLVLLLSLVSVVLAEEPSPCPGPKMFDAYFRRYDRERGVIVHGFMAYDEIHRRIREIEDVSAKGEKDTYDILRLHEQNIEYRVDRKTKECMIRTPRHPFRPLAVPSGATYTHEGVIGAADMPNEQVTVVNFQGNFEGNFYMITVTSPDCFPVEMGFFSEERGIEISSFYDLQEGISNPDFFLPPEECALPE